MLGLPMNARAIIDSETESFTEEPIHEYFVQQEGILREHACDRCTKRV